MIDCCFHIGCFGHCENVKMSMLAKQTGTHTVEHYHAGAIAKFDIELTAATLIEFPHEFNESGTTTFQILQPDGTYFTENVVTESRKCCDSSTTQYEADCFKVDIVFIKS